MKQFLIATTLLCTYAFSAQAGTEGRAAADGSVGATLAQRIQSGETMTDWSQMRRRSRMRGSRRGRRMDRRRGPGSAAGAAVGAAAGAAVGAATGGRNTTRRPGGIR